MRVHTLFRCLIALATALLALGCGVKGNPQPPDVPPPIGKGIYDLVAKDQAEPVSTDAKGDSELETEVNKKSSKKVKNK